MPITAKLSKEFYDKFGHAIVDELVNWLNQMDTSYRSELREVNELNFARFDAKLDQRIAEVRADVRLEIGELRAEMRAGFAAMNASLDAKLNGLRSDVVKWSFIFWATTALAVIGLYTR